MTKEAIKVYCRVKPAVGISTTVEYDLENNRSSGNGGTIEFYVPDYFNIRHTHNKSSSYKFRFNDIFDQHVEQEEVFDDAAKPVLDNCLKGFNGTVFVYGQTATGKTYTITGEDPDEKIKTRSPTKRTRRKKVKKANSPSSQHLQPIAEAKVAETSEAEKPTEILSAEISEEEKPIEIPNVEVSEAERPIEILSEPAVGAEDVNAKPPNPEGNTGLPPSVKKQPLVKTRGIVPRTLAYLFSYLSDYQAESEMAISYYEIYKESGYDLLNGFRQKRRVIDLNQLTQIKAMTDAHNHLHLKNLSRHIVTDEREALELLEHGNASRQVAETHLNDASSRSHCIFTIYLTIKHPETEKILQPKIHLVDLAGSERIGKSHETSEKIMTEGRNINLSLHHLQQVIVSLSKKKATLQHHKHHHVPYRNSTMTLVLRDSLGGTSHTSMIATISAEEKNLEESISTCRFAQQVATITNKVVINETQDSDLMIARLQEELEETKRLLETALRTTSPAQTIAHTIENLAEMIQNYLDDEDEHAELEVGFNNENIQFCFKDMKRRLLEELDENKRLQEAATTAATNNKKSKACTIL